jgi:hypothetical protein
MKVCKVWVCDTHKLYQTPSRITAVRDAAIAADARWNKFRWEVPIEKCAGMDRAVANAWQVDEREATLPMIEGILKGKARSEKRKADTKAKIVLGSALLSAMRGNPVVIAMVESLLDDYVSNDSDRETALAAVEARMAPKNALLMKEAS